MAVSNPPDTSRFLVAPSAAPASGSLAYGTVRQVSDARPVALTVVVDFTCDKGEGSVIELKGGPANPPTAVLDRVEMKLADADVVTARSIDAQLSMHAELAPSWYWKVDKTDTGSVTHATPAYSERAM